MEEILKGNFNRCSSPSDLRITDIRFTDIVGAPMHCTLLKIYTNQGIVGLGEVRDGANRLYAEMLKSRLIGENLKNVDAVIAAFRAADKENIDPQQMKIRIQSMGGMLGAGAYLQALAKAEKDQAPGLP